MTEGLIIKIQIPVYLAIRSLLILGRITTGLPCEQWPEQPFGGENPDQDKCLQNYTNSPIQAHRSWKQHHQCPCQCQLCIITGLSSVKEEVVVVGEETDDAGGVVGGGANNLHAVSSLEVGLDQLVIFPITQRQRFEVRAPQPATRHFVSDDTFRHHSASENVSVRDLRYGHRNLQHVILLVKTQFVTDQHQRTSASEIWGTGTTTCKPSFC